MPSRPYPSPRHPSLGGAQALLWWVGSLLLHDKRVALIVMSRLKMKTNGMPTKLDMYNGLKKGHN